MAKEKQQEESLEVALWKSADKLRKNIDAAEYKHVVLGLVFLKYISDSFEEHYNTLLSQVKDGADLKIKTNTKQKIYSSCHPLLDGVTYLTMQNYPRSAK